MALYHFWQIVLVVPSPPRINIHKETWQSEGTRVSSTPGFDARCSPAFHCSLIFFPSAGEFIDELF
jgi:hypothetical protein